MANILLIKGIDSVTLGGRTAWAGPLMELRPAHPVRAGPIATGKWSLTTRLCHSM